MKPSPLPSDVQGYAPRNYLNAPATGLASWLNTRDHKRIGVMFLIATTIFFAVGGLFAMLIRIELLTPGPTIMDAMTYNRMFTLHGVVMIFLFMIPAIPSGFGNFLLPLMLGAKDVAFPKLNLLSFYVYLVGALIALFGMIHGGADTGWTFYTPYSTTTVTSVVPILFGAFVLGFSSILTGLNFIVTTHTMRAPGMTWMKMPLFVWSIYATSIIQILATPVLGMTLLLVAVEHVFGWGIFNPALGGDPVLFQHFFWFYSHPAVYIMVLPAMAVISEVVCAFAHKNIFGYKAVAYSSLGIAFVGFFTWGHHLFTSGQSAFDAGIFGILSMFVGIFTAIKVFNWTATLYKGQIAFKTPFAYFVGFLFFLVFGGMTGVALATVSLDVHWQDTYFVVAHFHFIMVGGVIMAFLAALHYWFPKITGRMYPEGWGLVAAVMIVLGFNFTFIPQFLLGNMGMPRRYFSYPARFQALNVASTAGASVLAIGLVIVLIYLLVSLRYGPIAGPNPWRSRGFEWDTPSPPPPENYEVTPVITHGPHEYDHENVGLPPHTHAPEPKHATSSLAHHFESLEKQQHASRLAMWVFLATEILLFTALFAAYAVYRFLYPDAFSEASRAIETWIGFVNTLVLVTSSFTVATGLHHASRGDGRKTALFFGLSVLLALVFLGLKALEYTHHFQEGQLPGQYYTFEGVKAPGASIFFSLYFLITGLHAFHVVVGMTVLVVVGALAYRGRFSVEHHVAVENAALYWHLVDLIWIFVFPLIYLV